MREFTKKDREFFDEDLDMSFNTSDVELIRNATIIKIFGTESLAVVFLDKGSNEDRYVFLSFPTEILKLEKPIKCSGLTKEKVEKLRSLYRINKERVYAKEFFYNCEKFRNRLIKSKNQKRFSKQYDCDIKNNYNSDDILLLFKKWQENFEKREKRMPMKDDFLFYLNLENQKLYNINILYFEISGNLVGIKVVLPHSDNSNLLIMRYGIFDHSYIGLEKFMDLAVVERFDGYSEITDCGDFTAEGYKNRLEHKLLNRKPDRIEEMYTIYIDNK